MGFEQTPRTEPSLDLLLGSILRSDSVERDSAERQIPVKDEK